MTIRRADVDREFHALCERVARAYGNGVRFQVDYERMRVEKGGEANVESGLCPVAAVAAAEGIRGTAIDDIHCGDMALPDPDGRMPEPGSAQAATQEEVRKAADLGQEPGTNPKRMRLLQACGVPEKEYSSLTEAGRHRVQRGRKVAPPPPRPRKARVRTSGAERTPGKSR